MSFLVLKLSVEGIKVAIIRIIISMNIIFTLASNVSSCAILGFSFVEDDGDDNIVCKIE